MGRSPARISDRSWASTTRSSDTGTDSSRAIALILSATPPARCFAGKLEMPRNWNNASPSMTTGALSIVTTGAGSLCGRAGAAAIAPNGSIKAAIVIILRIP